MRVALRTGAPIMPCAIVGAEEIHPWWARPTGSAGRSACRTSRSRRPSRALGPLGLLPLPTKWSIDFGEPIDLGEHGPEGAEDPILVNRIAESVRATVQQMIDGRLARRRSIWFG